MATAGPRTSRFTELTGCRKPFPVAGMVGPAVLELCAAVTDAGGLGMVGVADAPPVAVAVLLERGA